MQAGGTLRVPRIHYDVSIHDTIMNCVFAWNNQHEPADAVKVSQHCI